MEKCDLQRSGSGGFACYDKLGGDCVMTVIISRQNL